MLDINSLSVQFFTDHVSGPQCPVISVIWNTNMNNNGLVESAIPPASKNADNPAEELLFILTKDAKVSIIDGDTGNMTGYRPVHLKKESIAVSLYIIGKYNFYLRITLILAIWYCVDF